MDERPSFQSDPRARRATPPVRAATSEQQPATKADLYAAVDALRGDMHELLEQIRTLIREATPGAQGDLGGAERETPQKLSGDW